MSGDDAALPAGVPDLEPFARDRLPTDVYDYYAGGAGTEGTVAENRRAFDRWLIRPRVLVDVSQVDTTVAALGSRLASPIGLAPAAFQRLAHPEGELATARAASSVGGLMVLSTLSTSSIEEVATAAGPRWFQLYVHRDRAMTEELVHRAEAAGYGAIVLTVDAPFLGRRWRDERNRFGLPADLDVPNVPGAPRGGDGSALFAYFASQLDPTLSWDDVAWLRSLTSLPVILKGILTAEDARLAALAGAAGVIVSNHGGRQLDGVPAGLDALPEVAGAVGDRLMVMVDGGVRQGTDALKALALGARLVFVGRPYLWGLAVAGEAGVRRVLETLVGELSLAMALAGMPSVAAVRTAGRDLVVPARR